MPWRIRNPLPKPLMGAGLIEVRCIRHEKPGELLLMENEEVIQAFSPHAPQKAFANSICSWSSIRRSQHLDATGGCHVCKTRPEFAISISNEIFRRLSI